MESMDDLPMIELLFLANHVESTNNLLYISGGGWTEHRRFLVPDQPAMPSHLGIAVSVLIPWGGTNRDYDLQITMERGEAPVDEPPLVRVGATINVGRPPNLRSGAVQHAMLGISIDTVFPQEGDYKLAAVLNTGDRREWSFRVVDMRGPQ